MADRRKSKKRKTPPLAQTNKQDTKQLFTANLEQAMSTWFEARGVETWKDLNKTVVMGGADSSFLRDVVDSFYLSPSVPALLHQITPQLDNETLSRIEHEKKLETWRFMAKNHLNELGKIAGTSGQRKAALAAAWANKVVSSSILLRTQQEPLRFGHDLSQSMLKSITNDLGGPEHFAGFELLGQASWGWDVEDIWAEAVYVWTIIKDIWLAVWNTLRSMTDRIWAIQGYVWSVYEALQRTYYVLRDQLQSNLRNIYNYVWEGAKNISANIWSSIVSLSDSAAIYINNLRSALVAQLTTSFDNLVNKLSGYFDSIKTTLQTNILLLTAGLDVLGNIYFNVVGDAADAISGKISSIAPDFIRGLLDAQPLFLGSLAYSFETTPGSMFTSAEQSLKALVTSSHNSIEKYLRDQAPITPAKVPGVAATAVATATGFGLAAHLSSVFFEIASPLKNLGLHQMSAFLANMGGYGAVTGATMGVFIAAALKTPFQYYAQDIFRPNIPFPMDLQMMAVKPDISMNDFRTGMRWHGFSEEWIDRYQTTMFKEPRYFELSFMLEDADATADWLYKKARRGGYSEEDAEIFVPALIKKVLRTQRQDLYSAATSLYKEGYVDRDEYYHLLEPLELRKEALETAGQAADLKYLYDNIIEMSKLFEDEYNKELITLEDLDVALTSLGMKEEKVELLVARAALRKLPKPRLPGSRPEDKELAKMQKQYIKLYTLQFKKEVISESEFELSLISAGLTQQMAKITVSLERTKRLKVPSVVAARSTVAQMKSLVKYYTKLYTEQFRKEIINQAQLFNQLVALGINIIDVTALVEIELLRIYEPPDALAA